GAAPAVLQGVGRGGRRHPEAARGVVEAGRRRPRRRPRRGAGGRVLGMTGRRVGVMGGTFDPIHLGHLAGARAAAETLRLDRVLWVPSSLPPHRPDRPRASGYHRFAMTALAIAGVPGWEASDVELARPGTSYTFETLVSLKERDPG